MVPGVHVAHFRYSQVHRCTVDAASDFAMLLQLAAVLDVIGVAHFTSYAIGQQGCDLSSLFKLYDSKESG